MSFWTPWDPPGLMLCWRSVPIPLYRQRGLREIDGFPIGAYVSLDRRVHGRW